MKDNLKKEREREKEKGSALVYTLLVISAILSTILIISNLATSQIKQSAKFNNALVSFYSAESGLELSLQDLRKNEVLPNSGDCGFSSVNCELTVEDQVLTSLTNIDLNPNESSQVDLYNPDDLNEGSGVEAINLVWQAPGWVEVSFVEWEPGLTVDWQDDSVQKFLYSSTGVNLNQFNSTKSYRVRFKALYNPVANLEITLCDQDNCSANDLPVPGYLKITSLGEYQNATQEVYLDIKRQPFMLGLFDYVLFSESKLIK